MQSPSESPRYDAPPSHVSLLLDDHTRQLFPLIWQITGKLTTSATIRYAIIQTAAQADQALKKQARPPSPPRKMKRRKRANIRRRSTREAILTVLSQPKYKGGAKRKEIESEGDLNPSMITKPIRELAAAGLVSKIFWGCYIITDAGRAALREYDNESL